MFICKSLLYADSLIKTNKTLPNRKRFTPVDRMNGMLYKFNTLTAKVFQALTSHIYAANRDFRPRVPF